MISFLMIECLLAVSSSFVQPQANAAAPPGISFLDSLRVTVAVTLCATPTAPTPVSSGSMRDLCRFCVSKPGDFVLSEFCRNFNLFFFL